MNSNYPPGVTDRNLESDLHVGPDFDTIAAENAQAEDDAYEKVVEQAIEGD